MQIFKKGGVYIYNEKSRQNLQQNQPPEKREEIIRKQVETRRRRATQKKRLKNVLKDAMKVSLDTDTVEALNDKLGAYIKMTRPFDNNIGEDEVINAGYTMGLALFVKALQGDTKAFELIRDTIGEKPVEKIETDSNVNGGFKVIIEDVKPDHD